MTITIHEQIQQAKKQKKQKQKDIYYIEDCNNCKCHDITDKNNITCKHSWYCHHDNNEVQELETKIAKIKYNIQSRGYSCKHELKELSELKNKRYQLIKKLKHKKNMKKIK